MKEGSTDNKLNVKQQAFVNEYLIDGNGSRAVQAAGYKIRAVGAKACALLKDVRIRAAIEERQKRLQISATVTLEETVANLRVLAKEAKKAGQYGAAVRAEELIGKTIAAFVDRSTIGLYEEKDPLITEFAALRAKELQQAGIPPEEVAGNKKLLEGGVGKAVLGGGQEEAEDVEEGGQKARGCIGVSG